MRPGEYLPRRNSKLGDSISEKLTYQNWKNVFDLSYVDNGWVHRGDSIQATFWELRKENIRKVWFFTSAAEKPENLEES